MTKFVQVNGKIENNFENDVKDYILNSSFVTFLRQINEKEFAFDYFDYKFICFGKENIFFDNLMKSKEAPNLVFLTGHEIKQKSSKSMVYMHSDLIEYAIEDKREGFHSHIKCNNGHQFKVMQTLDEICNLLHINRG